MTREERQKLRDAALSVQRSVEDRWRQRPGRDPYRGDRSWELQTSNSWRRIGAYGDGDVLCPTTHHVDRHPDLTAPPGVLEYLVAVQPSVVLDLLDQLSAAEQLLDRFTEVEARLDEMDRKFREAQLLVELLRNTVKARGGD